MSPYPRRNIEKTGPEKRLVKAFLSQNRFIENSLPEYVLEEPRLPTGYPDIIALYTKRARMLTDCAELRLTPDHLKILHHLHLNSGDKQSNIINRLLYSQKKLNHILDDLLMKKLIYKRSGLLLPRSISKVFCLKKIISIEAKIKDWRKAIEQAIMNTWYASHSYVLFPRTSISIKAIGSAKKYGIGIISFEENKPKVLLKPLIRKLPASYGSWMLNDLIIHNKTRTGDDYIGRYKN